MSFMLCVSVVAGGRGTLDADPRALCAWTGELCSNFKSSVFRAGCCNTMGTGNGLDEGPATMYPCTGVARTGTKHGGGTDATLSRRLCAVRVACMSKSSGVLSTSGASGPSTGLGACAAEDALLPSIFTVGCRGSADRPLALPSAGPALELCIGRGAGATLVAETLGW